MVKAFRVIFCVRVLNFCLCPLFVTYVVSSFPTLLFEFLDYLDYSLVEMFKSRIDGFSL